MRLGMNDLSNYRSLNASLKEHGLGKDVEPHIWMRYVVPEWQMARIHAKKIYKQWNIEWIDKYFKAVIETVLSRVESSGVGTQRVHSLHYILRENVRNYWTAFLMGLNGNFRGSAAEHAERDFCARMIHKEWISSKPPHKIHLYTYDEVLHRYRSMPEYTLRRNPNKNVDIEIDDIPFADLHSAKDDLDKRIGKHPQRDSKELGVFLKILNEVLL